jgi:phage tail-like protein
MNCGGGTPTFRLLDAYVGWDVGSAEDRRNLTGLEDPEGVRLAQVMPGAVDPNVVSAYIPPPLLAPGCGPCEWYLATPVPPAPRLLRRNSCPGQWLPVWDPACDPQLLVEPVAIAARGHQVAVADAGAHTVWIWNRGGEQLTAAIRITQPGPIAFAPWGELLVTSTVLHEPHGSQTTVWTIRRFDLTGEPRGMLQATIPEDEEIERIAVSSDCAIWLVTRSSDDALQLWRAARGDMQFHQAAVEDLVQAFKPTGLIAVSALGFCLEEGGTDGLPLTHCFSWYGRPIGEQEIKRSLSPTRYTQGQLLTQAIDSGIPRCRWHRLRVEADVPPGTTVSIAISTSETETLTAQGDPTAEPAWQDFPAGIPHLDDWQIGPNGSLDFLSDQPPGRFLFLRLRLTGDGRATPVIRRIQLVFPRVTSLEFLPPVYREQPEAEDFTERFLALFDASIAEVDRAIERIPALLDSDGVPDEVLPWLSGFLDVAFDQAWDAERLRAILRAVPELYRRRGTVAGLAQAIQLIFDVSPAIQELAADRQWGGLGAQTRLGAVRLFGKARARFRLGSSALSTAPLRSFGDPDTDPLTAQSHRFRVLVPPGRVLDPAERARLEHLVASQKPAHTVASIRVGGDGFVIGNWSTVGVDTVFRALPPPVLGTNVRLRRMSVLWHGPRGRRTGTTPGLTTVVGVTTIT